MHSNVMLRFMVQALQDRYVAAPQLQTSHEYKTLRKLAGLY
jgi:hypothetical protein